MVDLRHKFEPKEHAETYCKTCHGHEDHSMHDKQNPGATPYYVGKAAGYQAALDIVTSWITTESKLSITAILALQSVAADIEGELEMAKRGEEKL
jgi:hypothetical protein